MLVRVSSLTATTTSYFNTPDARTSAAKKALPSIPLSPPTVPRTSSSMLNARPTVLATPSARETVKLSSIFTESISGELAALNPPDSASTATTSLASKLPIETRNSDVELVSRSNLPAPVSSQEPSDEHSASEPTAPASTALGSQAWTSTQSLRSLLFSGLSFTPSNPELSQELKTSAPLIGNGITDSGTFVTHGAMTTISGTPVSLELSSIGIGTQTAPLPANQPNSVFSVAGHTFTANPTGFLIGSTRLLSNGPAVTISDTPVSLGASGIVIGTKTIPLPSDTSLPVLAVGEITSTANPTGFLIGSTRLLSNGPAVTISDTPVSLGASGIVIGTKTIALPSDTSLPVLTVGGITFTANPTGFLIGSTRLLSNGPAVTISDTPVSLGASGIVIGTKTIPLPSDSPLPVFTVGGITFTANPTGFDVGTFSPHGELITTSRTPISPSLPNIVIETRSIGLPAASSILTVNGQEFTANPSGFIVGDTEIHRGGSPVTISGTPILLESSALVIGSSTVPLASVTHGLGSAILSGLGYTAVPTPTDGAAAGNYSRPLEPYAGGQIKTKAPIILLASCVGLVGVIWA
ncbi:hypothetical protein MMC29_007049 [Sticta canariensis]|nr:hypothetical protein [Sticta canariensis]